MSMMNLQGSRNSLCPCVWKGNGNAGAWILELGVDVDGDGVPLLDIGRKLSVRTNGDGRSRAFSTTLGTVNHVAIFSSWKTRLETRVPILIRVVDRDESRLSTSKRDEL
jgi:hypothetical protein